MKDCPDCGESILETALKCRFCGVVLEADAYEGLKDERPPLYLRKFSVLWIPLLLIGASGTFLGSIGSGSRWSPAEVGFLLGSFAVMVLGGWLLVRDVRKRKGGVLLGVGFGWLFALTAVTAGALAWYVLVLSVVVE